MFVCKQERGKIQKAVVHGKGVGAAALGRAAGRLSDDPSFPGTGGGAWCRQEVLSDSPCKGSMRIGRVRYRGGDANGWYGEWQQVENTGNNYCGVGLGTKMYKENN